MYLLKPIHVHTEKNIPTKLKYLCHYTSVINWKKTLGSPFIRIAPMYYIIYTDSNGSIYLRTKQHQDANYLRFWPYSMPTRKSGSMELGCRLYIQFLSLTNNNFRASQSSAKQVAARETWIATSKKEIRGAGGLRYHQPLPSLNTSGGGF